MKTNYAAACALAWVTSVTGCLQTEQAELEGPYTTTDDDAPYAEGVAKGVTVTISYTGARCTDAQKKVLEAAFVKAVNGFSEWYDPSDGQQSNATFTRFFGSNSAVVKTANDRLLAVYTAAFAGSMKVACVNSCPEGQGGGTIVSTTGATIDICPLFFQTPPARSIDDASRSAVLVHEAVHAFLGLDHPAGIAAVDNPYSYSDYIAELVRY